MSASNLAHQSKPGGGSIEREALLSAARDAVLAARTAPKGKGRDLLYAAILVEAEKDALAERMEEIARERDHKGFLRDAGNVRTAEAIILVGAAMERMGLSPCGLCGYLDCAANEEAASLCAFAPGDLGIAIGSLVSILADRRVDNRVMYTAGVAALKFGLFPPEVRIAYGIPLSATGKSPFFDRKNR
jgi:uncharacterized ferredoxin-like protein